jgi:hypothetical protein
METLSKKPNSWDVVETNRSGAFNAEVSFASVVNPLLRAYVESLLASGFWGKSKISVCSI